ncbi:MAG TPA: TolC family protein [Bacteroidia bacterium]|nr:TolC family protein [Bacteroidia bacterium]
MKKFLFIIILICVVQTLFAQEKLTLQQAIETGLKNNYSIIIAKNESEMAKNNATLGNAGMLPQINLGLTQNNSVTDTKQKYSTGSEVNRTGATSNSLNAYAALDWTIFDGFKMFAAYNKLKELNTLGDLQARQIIENTVSEIISAYFDIVKQQALLTVIDTAQKISAVKLNIAKTKFNIGSSSKVEYLQAQVDMNAGISSYKKQQITIDASKVNLNKLLARDVSLEYEVADSIEINYNPTYEDLKAKAGKDNTSLQIAQRNITISGLTIKELRAERFPVIGLNGSYDYSKSTSQANFVLENRTTGFNYGFTATYNLFNGFTLNKRIKNAKLDLENSNINFNSAQTEVNAELIIAFKNFENNLELLQMEESNGNLAKENVDLSLERFKVGAIDQLQLKEAQQSYVEAQNRLVNARFDTKIAETGLKKLAGELLK